MVVDISIRNEKSIDTFGKVPKTKFWNLEGEKLWLFKDKIFEI